MAVLSRAALVALLGAAALLAAAAPAGAAPRDGDRAGRGGGGGAGGGSGLSVGADGPAQRVGTVNPLAVKNPFCDEQLRRAERRNCRVTGTPEGRYPSSNYGIDIHIDTGLDNIVGNFQALLAHIANAIWQACLFVLNLVLTLLGWAFGLSPFSDNATLREVDAGLERFYRAFTEPWLIFAMVAIGAWGIWRGLVRREVSASIAGTLLSVALMIAALWVVNEPRDTVGRLSDYSNRAALSVLAAPQGGLENPAGGYTQATAQVWNDMTIPGFAALNFSDVDWALSDPDPELLKTASEWACLDAAYLAQIPPRRWQRLAEAPGDLDCGDLAAFAPRPRTNAEIYLRSSPGSRAREALWDEHTDSAPYSSYFAIQGEGGAWTRLPLVVLLALGLLGGICLLTWLALRLLVQTAVAFVLVLMAPLALFLPAFGERGRAAFAAWGATLAGALVAKLVYAALLSVVLFATAAVASLVDGIGAMVAFLVMAGLWWAVFLKRESLISFMSVSDGEPGDGGFGRGMFGLYAAAQLGQRMVSPIASRVGAGSGRETVAGLRADRGQATRTVARSQLASRAARRLDSRLERERGLVARQDQRRSRLAAIASERGAALSAAKAHERAAPEAAPGRERERHERAHREALERAGALSREQARLREAERAAAPRAAEGREFVAGAERRERLGGERWSEAELRGAREGIRSELDRPLADPAHAWRAGMSRERYSALSGAERERVHRRVGAELRRDRAAFGVIPDRPQGLIGRRASGLRYRGAAHAQPGGAVALAAARRDAARRRRARHPPRRRGVSR